MEVEVNYEHIYFSVLLYAHSQYNLLLLAISTRYTFRCYISMSGGQLYRSLIYVGSCPYLALFYFCGLFSARSSLELHNFSYIVPTGLNLLSCTFIYNFYSISRSNPAWQDLWRCQLQVGFFWSGFYYDVKNDQKYKVGFSLEFSQNYQWILNSNSVILSVWSKICFQLCGYVKDCLFALEK